MNDQIRNPVAFAKRQEERSARRNISQRMEERSNRVGLNIQQQAYFNGVFADKVNDAALVAHLNSGGTIDNFVKPLNDEKVISATIKRLAKKAGLLNKYGVTFKKN